LDPIVGFSRASTLHLVAAVMLCLLQTLNAETSQPHKSSGYSESEFLSAAQIVILGFHDSVPIDYLKEYAQHGKSARIRMVVSTIIKGDTADEIYIDIPSTEMEFAPLLGLVTVAPKLRIIAFLEKNQSGYNFSQIEPKWLFAPDIGIDKNHFLEELKSYVLTQSQAPGAFFDSFLGPEIERAALKQDPAYKDLKTVLQSYRRIYVDQIVSLQQMFKIDSLNVIISQVERELLENPRFIPASAKRLIENPSEQVLLSLIEFGGNRQWNDKQRDIIEKITNLILLRLSGAVVIAHIDRIDAMQSTLLTKTALYRVSDLKGDPKAIALFLKVFSSSSNNVIRYAAIYGLAFSGIKGCPDLPDFDCFQKDPQPTIESWEAFISSKQFRFPASIE